MFKNANKKTKIIVLSLIVTTILLLGGLTYAYFSAGNINGNENNTIEIVTARGGNVIVHYPNGNNINTGLMNLLQSEANTTKSYMMKFSLENTASGSAGVTINWKDVNSTFCQYASNQTCTDLDTDTYVGDELTYELYECSLADYNDATINYDYETECIRQNNSRYDAAPKTAYTGRLHQSGKITILGDQTKYYVLLLHMHNKATEQNYNQGKSFTGKIFVDNVIELGDLNILAMTLNGEDVTTLPSTGHYNMTSYNCAGGETLTWDDYTKTLSITPIGASLTSCAVDFETNRTYYETTLNGADPELYQGMIPVNISSSGVITVADQSTEWYNYANREWANAVLINAGSDAIKTKYFNEDMSIKSTMEGQTIPMDDIVQMYVWIPRYKYKLWNVANGNSNPFAIDIVFENNETPKSSGKVNTTFTNGLYYTHPAFTFGSTELNGYWVGKFESSGSTTAITVKPNLYSLTNQTLGAMFNGTRAMENTYASVYGIDSAEIDTRVIKNTEWGAMAYLTNSTYGRYINASTCVSSGCEVWINNRNTGTGTTTGTQWGPSITGCSGESVSAAVVNYATSCAANRTWETNGINASTTGNITGIYDVSGGAWEYTMGNMKSSGGSYYALSSGLTDPGSKYYDIYNYSATAYTDHARGLIGDATKETLVTYGSEKGGWYSDYAYLPHGTGAWTLRGGYAANAANAGVFSFSRVIGGADAAHSFRVVLSGS